MRRPTNLLLVLVLSASVAADEKAPSLPQQAADLQRDVLSLFTSRCVKCHGPGKPKAKLNLATFTGIARGSQDGSVVEPGNLEDSLLWQVIEEERMPPDGPLSDAERSILRGWIESGAPGLPSPEELAKAPQDVHWAFVAPVQPAVPGVLCPDRVRTDVDRFIQAALERKQLSLGPVAERRTLVRRVSFDLTGLPPTSMEIEAFLSDSAPDAYERMLDRYLASPHYGERWGKYWLDAAGYADSNGYFDADSDRPLAWRYRDYVVRSFNDDKPYDQFVREQLAGDELAGYEPEADLTPEMGDKIALLTATHFLRNAPDGTGESDGNPDELRTDRLSVLEGTLQVTMSCLLGITIQCARCHDHKFEPITQEEYYRLQTIFFPVYCPDRWTKPSDRVVALATRAQREEYRRHTEQTDRQIRALNSSLETIAVPLREQIAEERWRDLDHATRASVLEAMRTAKEKRSPEQEALLAAHAEALKISEEDLAKRFPEYVPVRDQIRKAVAEREKDRPPPLEKLSVFAETDPSPPVHHLLIRGQHNAPGAEVEPGVPAALCTAGNIYAVVPPGEGRKTTGRRSALACWMTAPENPLFARVMVNRIWQGHFGTGLVATAENLGQSGTWPSHPELLDYLATEFIRSGWSVKAIHRLIMRSAVYRQSSAEPTDVPQAKAEAVGVYPRLATAPHNNGSELGEVVPLTPTLSPRERGSNIVWALASLLGRKGSALSCAVLETEGGGLLCSLVGRDGWALLSSLLGTYDGATSSSVPGAEGGALLRSLVGREGEALSPSPLEGEGWGEGDRDVRPVSAALLNGAALRNGAAGAVDPTKIDPENRLLWRFPMRRLDAEAVRDAMLAVSGELDRRAGGPYVPTRRTAEGSVDVDDKIDGARRRSIYLQQRRSQVLTMLELFDAPSMVTNCTFRNTSTVPLQSLALLNSEFARARALAFASRLERDAGTDMDLRITLAFTLACGRSPNDGERALARRFLTAQQELYAQEKDGSQRAWADFCQMILASNAFLYIE